MWMLNRKSNARSAFESTVLVHIDALYGTALRLTRDVREAEDLVQDTMLSAFRHFERFLPGSNARAWLYKILHNTFIDKYRRSKRERLARDLMIDDDLPNLMSEDATRTATSPDDLLAQPLLSDDVKRALEALPYEYRMAVVLCDLEEFAYKEIADILDCPVGTVMSRLHRGRRLLQKALLGYAVGEGIVKSSDDAAKLADVIQFPVSKTS